MKQWLSLYLLFALAPNTQAAVSFVNVGGDTNTFSPQTINIRVGDTVTFLNKGGIHNVVADDGSFRCAHGCAGDGMGDTGAPSSNWEVSVTFTEVGTVGYYCETHGQPGSGMYGTIIVQAPTPVQLQSFNVD